MVKLFSIHYEKNQVGYAKCTRQGLYYHISCDVKRIDNNLYRVYVIDSSKIMDLGICVPEGNRFVINKRIPIKSFDGEPERFILIADADVKHFVPVLENVPFDYIQKLDKSKYYYYESRSYIVCTKP